MSIAKGETNWGTTRKALADHQRRGHGGMVEEGEVWVSGAACLSGKSVIICDTSARDRRHGGS